MATQHAFYELGYFPEYVCKEIRKALQGKSYYSFDIQWSNQAGNCILIVSTARENTSEEELKNTFLGCALEELAWLS